ncbi:MAG TPA: A/G-specific adenine glycosylase [Lacipirellulaceae bacterium]
MSTAAERKSSERQARPAFSSAQRQSLRRRLLAWYRDRARDLPWRHSRDPYRVWVSEVMLQQTQVATVREYFERFTAAIPDVHQLAAADEQRVLRLWEGLGYYRRARQLHATAKEIVAQHGGEFPSDTAELIKLPGIGRYTAGAIASIAFGRRAPILEANTIRLLSRLIRYEGDTSSAAGQRLLWQTAEEILPRTNVAQFNQALMELGSLVCTPAEPECRECPLSVLCAAYASSLQHEIPRPKSRAAYILVREAAVVVRRRGRILLRQCGPRERWAGLWDFPRFAIEGEGPLFAAGELAEKVLLQTGIRCIPGPLLKRLKHGVTRFRITLDCYEAAYAGGRARSTNGAPVRWVKGAELASLPLSTTGRKLAKLVSM